MRAFANMWRSRSAEPTSSAGGPALSTLTTLPTSSDAPAGASAERELLRTLTDSVSALLGYWDSTLHCRFANRAYERWFGVPAEALVGKHAREVLPEPLYQLNLPYIEGALRGERQEFEREFPDPSGGPPRHSLTSYVPDVVEGVVRGFFVMVTDISAIKRVELALRESEERFRLTFDVAPIGMALLAPDGRFVRVNRALCEVVGYTPDELTGMTFQAITHPEDLDADLALTARLARGEIARQLGTRCVRKDGSSVDIMLSTSILRGREGAAFDFIAQIEDVTERRRLENELRLAEAKSTGILQSSADAIISIDVRQRITMFNKGAEVIFGYSGAEAIGTPFELLIVERSRATHRQDLESFAAGSEVARRLGVRGTAIVAVRKSGEEFPAEATVSRVHIGGMRFLTVTLRDITEQRRAQDQLRQSQERLELALEGADLASWDWNLQTGEVIFNPRWAEMRGFRPDEIKGHVSSRFTGLHADDRARVDKALTDYFLGLSPEYESEHRVRTKTGQWLWVLDRGKVFARDEAGRPTRMVGTELDITERKRVQDEQCFLAEVGAVLASTLDLEDTLMAIARLSVRQLADCVIVDLVEESDEVRRLLVVHSDPSKARLCEQLKQFRLDRKRPHLASAILETEQPTLMREIDEGYIVSVAQGEAHLRALRELDPRSMMAVPLRSRERLLGGLLFISSSGARRYDRRDLAFAQELAHRAALAIENARLYETAQRATQMRDDLLGIVAHDLRSPLSTILMRTALLRRRGSEPERRSRNPADTIERAATRMNRLIQDLLDVTCVEAGRLSVKLGPVSTGQLVIDSVESQEPLAASASVALRREVDRDLPEIWADRDRLFQVFDNLIGNAMKFTERGGSVTVGAAPRQGEVLFWVVDTGAGIDPEHLPHLFDRFWQARSTGRRGAGLGLPIVKSIVESHRGRIWVESKPGQGSSFFFTIPTVNPSEVAP